MIIFPDIINIFCLWFQKTKIMNTNNLLDEILLMLQLIKDKPEQLEKLHQYMLTELDTEDTESAAILVPKQHIELVKDVADRLSAGLVCYINPDTLEIIDIPQAIADTIMFEEDEEEEEENEEDEDDPFYADLKRIHRDWEQTITINPPESTESFSFMEQFVNTLPESRISNSLADALSKKKPFRHFNSIIHQSDERDAWFAFRQKCLENYVAEILAGRLWKNEGDN